MNKGLYTRLAGVNIRQNKQFYIPYLLTGIFTVAMFYIILALQGNDALNHMSGGGNIKMILGFGTVIIGLCAVVFLFYTNSFIIKRRKKELGVYNILGMEKRHISRVLLYETFFTAFIAIAVGLATGILFNKLMCMVLYKMMGYDAGIGFYVSTAAIRTAIELFAVIYILTFLYDLWQVRLANPVELLHGGSVGEREPKTKLIMTIVGFICLGIGYYIAITTKSPLKALMLFFVAVLLVIIGTYCLFMAGSIALLKMLRKNKGYYYKSRHFTAVSGMLYRMKQNAVGLANICILSTMVLVVLSTTFSMFIGIEDELETRYPYDISVEADYGDAGIVAEDEVREATLQAIETSGRSVRTKAAYAELSFAAMKEGNGYILQNNFNSGDYSNVTMLTIITKDGYWELFGEQLPELADNEVILVSDTDEDGKVFSLQNEKFAVKEVIKQDIERESYMLNMMSGSCYVVVNDKTQLTRFYNLQRTEYGENASEYRYKVGVDIDGTKEEKIACVDQVVANIEALDNVSAFCESRAGNEDEFRMMYGGFFFLGAYLGIMFLMITVLIIFYKQISEGYDDKERFAIMEKVGMSNKEVKGTIQSQIRIVFFLPLLTAVIHVIAAFPLITRLLLAMNLSNVKLFAIGMTGTVIAFAIIYLIVFLITSRTYYKIVGRQV